MSATTDSDSRRISIFDTTLRDGEQAPANALNPPQKLEMALRIEALGADWVEAGFPASSPSEFEATRLISRSLTTARFTTFCRAVRSDIETAVTAGGTDRHQVQILATGSDMHLRHKRGISRAQAVDEVAESVGHAHALGVESVSVGIEDASRGEDGLLRDIAHGAVEAGATCLVIADTSGCHLPQEYAALITKFRTWLPDSIRISTHCHNDFGLSLANAVAGLEAGADEVQATLGGIGERAGNTPLEELAALLSYKGVVLGLHTDIDVSRMYEAYTVLRGMIGLEEPRNKAIFGTYAFGTAAGIHQQGMLRNPATYEYVEPARFGRGRTLLVGRHSGRAVLRHVLDELRVVVSDEELAELYRTHITERAGGDCEDISVLKDRLARELLERPLPAAA
ncbi:LeuA family protein [Streptomyces tsukubensis]|uniref:2-isopropylmalate synthase n=1 Tax=Streptomyces tsukubensis TaxID=83656 RepID=A0A1V4A4N5_9ACTN|nr:pyruvate carboxyltransferase [Streptomyces tsukubensis]OON75390.1 pyruvate carboxyltransferase [Streptomyces tsukubensis]QFR94980.1 pyruvate carboxyltransferase [Streptomyces tsukubensis]